MNRILSSVLIAATLIGSAVTAQATERFIYDSDGNLIETTDSGDAFMRRCQKIRAPFVDDEGFITYRWVRDCELRVKARYKRPDFNPTYVEDEPIQKEIGGRDRGDRDQGRGKY